MYTSDIKRYLAASAVVAVCSGIYEYFSHGVLSAFMIFAFAIPLVIGALPLIAAGRIERKHTAAADDAESGDGTGESRSAGAGSRASALILKLVKERKIQLALIATLTAGSLLKGVLDIYGTTNSLLIVYPAAAAVLAALWASRTLRSA